MSRRTAPADNRVEQNRATLKSLVKLEANKTCADCKKNKHPRWASWNLGIFVCIRCSGIHRGLGTHISRVKSVDLDSWTDEQTQSMLKWGNSRANKYWEAKLAPGHVPSESKIENFIRTKYESKRWTMDGAMPDPETLDGGDEDMPLNVVQQKVSVERSTSQRQAASRATPKVNVDLFSDDISAPARPATGPPIGSQPPPKVGAAAPKQTKPSESLLGLDFFGSAPAPPARPSSEMGGATAPVGPSKTDLKQSILSLYSSAPKPALQSQVQSPSGGFGGFPGMNQPAQQNSAFGGMDDAFGSLSLSSPSTTSPPPSKPSAFDSLASNFTSPKPTTTTTTPSLGAGGGFFSAAPKSPPVQAPAHAARQPSSGGFGDLFSSSTSPPATQSKPAPSMSADLFDLSAPATTTTALPPSNPMTNMSSAFNLSSKPPAQQTKPAASAFSNLGSGIDGWGGGSDVWGAPESNTGSMATSTSHVGGGSSSVMDAGWGSTSQVMTKSTKPTETTIAGDEDFGGWNSAPTVASGNGTSGNAPAASKPPTAGFGGNDDLFGNVWG